MLIPLFFTMVDFRIRSNNIKPADGRILISEPLMNSLFFGRSVVLLIEHIESAGTFGVVMNKPMRFNISSISGQFPDFDAPVFLGGPVAKEQIFFIHTLGETIPDSVKIIDGLFWGGNVEVLSMLVTSGIANSSNVRFFWVIPAGIQGNCKVSCNATHGLSGTPPLQS